MEPQITGVPEPEDSGQGVDKSALVMALLTVFLILAIGFGAWAFSKMNSYKNNSEAKVAAAVGAAQKAEDTKLQAQFDQQNKLPYKSYQGSLTYGSITFNYPKSWSAYVDTSNTSEPINGYFYPDVVPGITGKTAYALRVELVDTDYAQALQQFDSSIQQGNVISRAYVPPKLQGASNVTAGVYLTGQINDQDPTQTGNMVIMKVRDKTLKIYSESKDFTSDFNDIVLGSLTFVP